ncbi:MAG: hypothetical protein EZS28_006399 [Streblomastix strix]|uniref:Reverse transcriptase domain-containing protein n=1 Tax=Streblomastix strix TaxID=222440 RepID=A0A5J4WT15_9EUKA|nr:MAG: hypothetical protein EZS28_006399 [Streblomastix strix]
MDNVQVYNPTFLVTRQDWRFRKIFGCRRINLLTQLAHFKMDGPQELRQILQESDYVMILDIKDTFQLVHVSPNLQPFLGFQFMNKSYIYLDLPFGWRRNPLLFSRTLAIAIRAVREKWKLKIQNYMDDINLIHQSKQQLKQMTLKIISFLSNLGWRLSPPKCVKQRRNAFNIQAGTSKFNQWRKQRLRRRWKGKMAPLAASLNYYEINCQLGDL